MPLPKPTLEYFEIDLATRTIRHHVDFTGSMPPLPARPEVVSCDFCCQATAPLWCRLVRPVCITVAHHRSIQYDGGYWRACGVCENLIRFDLKALVVRIRNIDPGLAIMPHDALMTLFSVLLSARASDEIIVWNSGDVLPVQPAE